MEVKNKDHDPIWQAKGFGWKCICGKDMISIEDRDKHIREVEK